MPVVEYKLHKVGKNAKRAPEWVDDGGYWQNPADNTMVCQIRSPSCHEQSLLLGLKRYTPRHL